MRRSLIKFSKMTYQETVERLFRLQAAGVIKLNLDIPHKLAQLLSFPERTFPSVHVAGTNGKGSVSTKIAKALELSGLRVGLYTSPHLLSFCERIQINGTPITEEEVVRGAQTLFEITDVHKIPATFFELTTLLAFDFFRAQKVDITVIETGLGGRLDATNIITPLLSVITSIDRDHMDLLGDTLEAIAAEKAGIIKPSIPVVCGPHAHFSSIVEKAKQMQSPLHFAPFSGGFYDEENQATARLALQLLASHFSIKPDAIEQGLKVRPPCRFEQRGNMILDVAHNPQGFKRLFEAMDLFYPGTPFRVLMGMCRDKEVEKCLQIASRRAEHIYLTPIKTPRAASVKELAETLQRLNYIAFSSPSIEEALGETERLQCPLLICGSFYLLEAWVRARAVAKTVGKRPK